MTSVTEAKRKRQNRTVTLHMGNTLAEYQDMISTGEGIRELIRRVEIADSLNWGCLADGHKEGCARRLCFTHHDDYTRWVEHFDGTRSLVSILLGAEFFDSESGYSSRIKWWCPAPS